MTLAAHRDAPRGRWSRRELLQFAASAPLALAAAPAPAVDVQGGPAGARRASVRIRRTDSTFEREPLIRPFGFKGGYMSEIWQTAVRAEADSGAARIGIGTQYVL